jgi:hypothetical protein
MTKGHRLAIAFITGAVVSTAVAFGEVWVKCLRPASESCVWARSYLELTLLVYPVVIGVPSGAVAYWLTRARTRQ